MRGLHKLTEYIEPAPRAITKQCLCGENFTIEDSNFAEYRKYCPACADIEYRNLEEQRARKVKAERQDQWERFAPLEYRETEIDRIPAQKQVKEALAWKYGRKGLILHGPTGRGKTRVGWLLLHREFMEGHKIAAVGSYDLSFRLPGLYAAGAEAVDEWLRELQRSRLVLLDDVFKSVLNERTESFLFALLSYRCEHGKPTLTTLNDTSETLAGRLSIDRGEPMLRRIKEYAAVINFG